MGHVIIGENSFKHHKIGDSVPMKVLNPNGDWTSFLPPFEVQAQHGLETFGCVSYSLNNVLDAQARFHGKQETHSDRFLAKVSGTVNGQGNSYQNVYSALTEDGVCPRSEWDWPAVNPVTWDEFYADIPVQVIKDALSFLDEWSVGVPQYLPLDVASLKTALSYSPVWFCTSSHSMMIYKMDDENFYIYDSEAAGTDGLTQLPFSWLPNIVAAANVQLTPKTMPTFDPLAFIAANDKKLVRYGGDGTLALILQSKFQVVTEARAGFAAMAMLEYGIGGTPVPVSDPDQWKALMGISVQF